MENTMVLNAMNGNVESNAKTDSVCRQQMPLTFLKSGEAASVLKIRGTDEFHHHLENIGFVPGADIRVISEHGGNYIIEVKGAQIALDKASASRIITG